MGGGEIAVILAVDEDAWVEVEHFGPKVKWITVSQDTLNKVLEWLKEKEQEGGRGRGAGPGEGHGAVVAGG